MKGLGGKGRNGLKREKGKGEAIKWRKCKREEVGDGVEENE